jgi:hypothetical protein
VLVVQQGAWCQRFDSSRQDVDIRAVPKGPPKAFLDTCGTGEVCPTAPGRYEWVTDLGGDAPRYEQWLTFTFPPGWKWRNGSPTITTRLTEPASSSY